MKNKILVVLLASAVAISCAPLGKYKPVTEVREDLYGRGVEAQDSTANLATLGWEEVFTDKTLQELIRTALENSIDMQVAYEHILQAKAKLQGAKLSYVPDLNAVAGIMPQWEKGSSPAYGYDFGLTASWTLDIFGKQANQIRLGKASVAQQEDLRQAVHATLVASVAECYYDLLMYDEEMRVARGMEETWQKTIVTINILKFEGFADEVAVNQYNATYAKILGKIVELEHAIEATENALSLLLAVPSRTFTRGNLDDQRLPDDLTVGVPVQMLTLRPDVRAAQRAVEVAFYTTKAAWLNFFPDLTISGSAWLTNSIGSHQPMSQLANLTGELIAPILKHGQNKATLRSAQSQQREAKLNFDNALLKAGKEVNDALISHKAACEMDIHYTNQVIALQKARDDTELLMENSQDKTYLDVLAAHNALFESEFAMVENRASKLTTIVSLYLALGGGDH